jgi:hypothetical protein
MPFDLAAYLDRIQWVERLYDPDWDVRLAAASALEPIRRARLPAQS